ncbi:HK97 family phage prohead protease [Fodinicurvata fenggangensis]|uniref:HK97 family phage prohead protease n=1 Tax=Fodinicurvata fenggangensis TaxID=1121830 RepID=UPI00047EDBEA|nr:HK97 family phage prohead protease [Fodinicurvata fenggangensis]
MTKKETRQLPASEVKFAADDETGAFSGYASVWNEPDSFGDVIQRGAFQKTLTEHRSQGGRPAMFWNHDPSSPIGVWDSLEEDTRGLKVSGRLVTDTTKGREAHSLLKAGAINGLSIGFRSRQSKRGANGGRVLTDLELVEISLVTLPAASKARVTSVRNAGRPTRNAAFVQAVRRAAKSLKGD